MSSFIKIDKSLINSGLSARAIICYGLLADRLSLSKANGWQDDRGYYIIYSSAKLASDLGIKRRNAFYIMDELRRAHLIESTRTAENMSKIYVLPVPEDFQVLSSSVLSSSASTDTLDLERLIDQAASLENVYIDHTKRQKVLDRILPRIDTVKNRFGYIRKVLRNWDNARSSEPDMPSYDLEEYMAHNTILDEENFN